MALELTEKEATRFKYCLNANKLKGKKLRLNEAEVPTESKAVSRHEDFKTLPANTKTVHLVIRPTVADICNLLDACPQLQVIQAPKSVLYKISESAINMMKMKGVTLTEGTVIEIKKTPVMLKKVKRIS